MNGNDIMRAINGIDERYISEADRKKKITVKRGELSRYAVKIACAIAAAMALAIPAGAYAYNRFIHQDNVNHYIKNADRLEERGLALNAQTEDDELRFTVDTLLCDGHQAYGILTVERIGENAGMGIDHDSYDLTVVYADTGEFITNIWGGTEITDGTEKIGQNRREMLINISDVDTDRGIKLLFHETTTEEEPYGDGELTGQVDNDNVPIRSDCELEVSFETNVKTVKLYDSEGNEITLSEFEAYSNTVMWKNAVRDEFKLIDKNGKKHKFKGVDHSGYMEHAYVEDHSFACFDELIDVDKYSGVEINGVEYLKAE